MGEREQGHPQLEGKFKASLGYERTAPKPNQTNQKKQTWRAELLGLTQFPGSGSSLCRTSCPEWLF